MLSAAGNVHAQTPGLIIKPHTATISPLDPNGDGFTAASITGFQLNDLAESELLFKDIPYVALEPTGDLRRGPAGLYSDIVRDPSTGSGVGVYNDGTNLIFRMRLGGTVSGSKCYAILIDTDSKFGASGPNADPNCLPQTTGVNGNPGFEIEIDLQTNFRVAVYNVDGISNPSVPTAAYATPLNTQISLALTATSGNPDFFYDWYVPLSDLTALGVTNSTPLRFAATTGMAPLPVVGGPKSDIFGIDDSEYSSTNDGWNALVPNIPPVTFTNLTSGGSGFAAVCTNAPLIDNPISVGS
ncbi:MAG TPA: hypothetical protein VEY71_02420, partial [Chitinophagales bacterium]|nr:hypothetical protein [Chitinophagales bacterium]